MADEIGFIAFYITFFLGVALFASFGGDVVTGSGDVSQVPTLDQSNLTLLSSLLFVLEIVIFFLTLGGLTIFGISALITTSIAILFNILLIYIIAKLVRGGG